MPGAGARDRRIIIQRPPTDLDTAGQRSEEWVTVCTPWARVEKSAGGESVQADQVAARQTVKFTILWRRGISPEMRVVYEGQLYRVEDVEEVGRRDGLTLTTSAFEVVPGGTG